MNLFTTFYDEKNKERRAELESCLYSNILDKNIKKIFLFSEILPEWAEVRKVKLVKLNRRPKYDDYIDYIAKHKSLHNSINIIANTDITFDDSILTINNIKMENVAFALSRWDVDSNGKAFMFKRRDSQDVWIVKGMFLGVDADFELGKAGCDNRFAYELKKVGYLVLNASYEIKTYHFHNTGIRNYNPTDRVPQPYYLPDPCVIPNHLKK